jgi:NifU-like protein
MAKGDLIGGALWDEYSDKVADRMNNPLNRGRITEEEAKEKNARLIVADFGAESCGDAVRLYWAVDESNDTIIDAKYESFGCGTAIASSDTMVDLCIGKTVDEAVKITNLDVEAAMRDTPDTPAVPPQKMHCSVMAYDVIKKAAAEYKGIDMDDIETEFIVCECARVSLDTIKEVIKINDLTTVEQITDYTKAGAFCKSCIEPGGHEAKDIYLVDILEQTLADMEEEKIRALADISQKQETDVPFADMTLPKKLKAIEEIIDVDLRPMLMMDGGNMEVIDLKENIPYFDLYIRYLGACSTCATSSTGTLYAIENVLKAKLDENIRVLPV